MLRTASKTWPLKVLTKEQVQTYHKEGALVLKNILPTHVTRSLQAVAELVENLPYEKGTKWMKYTERQSDGVHRLCTCENWLEEAPSISEVANGLIRMIASDIYGCEALLHKEKMNFKLPGGGNFPSHIDHTAFMSFPSDYYVSALMPVDDNSASSGWLEVSKGWHRNRKHFPYNSDISIRTDIEAKMNWVPLNVQPGDIAMFDSWLPHRSDINNSPNKRRNIYLTYNRTSENNTRPKYFELKRKIWPPPIEREPSRFYIEGYHMGANSPQE